MGSRREWLAKVAAGVSLLCVVAGSSVYLKLTRSRAVSLGYLFFDSAGLRLASALIDDLVKHTGASIVHGAVLNDVDRHLASLPPPNQRDIKILLRFLEFHPVSRRVGYVDGQISSIEHPSLFLDTLRNSHLSQFRVTYRFLVSVTQLHFFKYSEAWPEGFSGLPEAVKRIREPV